MNWPGAFYREAVASTFTVAGMSHLELYHLHFIDFK